MGRLVTRLKILCIDQGGSTTSVAAGFILKHKYGHDVLACGWKMNSPGTIKMLINWADRVILTEVGSVKYLSAISADVESKLFFADVTVLGNPLNDAGQTLLMPILDKWHYSGYRVDRTIAKRRSKATA